MSQKEIKLTNWQVPKSPEAQKYEILKQAPAFDPKNYANVAGIDYCPTVQAVAEKLMQKREAVTGVSINAPPEPNPLNLKGTNDDRPDKTFWHPPRTGNR